jgi:Iron-containing redox enzyme
MSDAVISRVGGVGSDACLPLASHKAMLNHYLRGFCGPGGMRHAPPADEAVVQDAEARWNQRLGQLVDMHANEVPREPSDFHLWYREWAHLHEKVLTPFTQYLAHEATLQEMALFFVAEEKVDSHFDDLMALAQIGTSGGIKLAIAQNYWDEMGNGDAARVHTVMFDTSVRYMKEHLTARGIDHDALTEIAEVYANATQLLMYGVRRAYWPRLIGALGILEHSASHRFQAMVDGCVRLGLPEHAYAYQRAHIGIDEQHGEEWLKKVVVPLVTQYPELIPEIASGIISRLYVARAYYQAIHSRLTSRHVQPPSKEVTSNA